MITATTHLFPIFLYTLFETNFCFDFVMEGGAAARSTGARPQPQNLDSFVSNKKATPKSVALIVNRELTYNCLSEKRIASSTEHEGFCLSTALSALSDAVRVNPNIVSAAKASS